MTPPPRAIDQLDGADKQSIYDHVDDQDDDLARRSSSRSWIFGDFHADTHHFKESPWQRAPKEIGCAAAAAALVSPLVSIIDRCLVQEISGRAQFARAMAGAVREIVSKPRTHLGGLGFRLTFAVYFGTYAVANLAEVALDMKNIKDDEERKQVKVGATGAANVGLLAWRDSVFARVYSEVLPAPTRTPVRTLGLFAARDVSTMYATFYLAPRAATYLQEEHGWDQNAAELSAALSIPAGMQLLTAPMHIHAMDYFARPSVSTVQSRFDVIRKELWTVSFARGFRILPAFGLGSFSNNKFRELFIRQDDDEMMPIQRRVTKILAGDDDDLAAGSGDESRPMLATSRRNTEA